MRAHLGLLTIAMMLAGCQGERTTEVTTMAAEVPAVEMKPACERCAAALARVEDGFHCTYNCTFCASCTTEMEHTCPNCGGRLLMRPHGVNR